MPSSLFMRGPVATGYGRGGKKLGVPTANLPQSLFKDSLANVKPGVYCGWASVDHEDGKTATCKAVVNVGYSPTFVGEENREKIVEAHLMGYEGGDFYDSEMRLVLSGFQRGEKKFPSFPDLVAAINQDIQGPSPKPCKPCPPSPDPFSLSQSLLPDVIPKSTRHPWSPLTCISHSTEPYPASQALTSIRLCRRQGCAGHPGACGVLKTPIPSEGQRHVKVDGAAV